jgi:ferredoxin
MIVGQRKALKDIKEMVKNYKKILNVGCGGCTSVCLSGGQKEVFLTNDELKDALKEDQLQPRIDGFTIERQCNADFFLELDEKVKGYDAILSMACGAGVQFVADRYPDRPVFPALDTIFIGADRDVGWYEENCRACADCVLGETAGICPVTRCAKSIFNGPCGGTSREGKCEVSKDTPCAWFEIHERLNKQGRLINIIKMFPPREWHNQTRRSLIHEAYKQRYVK